MKPVWKQHPVRLLLCKEDVTLSDPEYEGDQDKIRKLENEWSHRMTRLDISSNTLILSSNGVALLSCDSAF
jgi:hypothetical protein